MEFLYNLQYCDLWGAAGAPRFYLKNIELNYKLLFLMYKFFESTVTESEN